MRRWKFLPNPSHIIERITYTTWLISHPQYLHFLTLFHRLCNCTRKTIQTIGIINNESFLLFSGIQKKETNMNGKNYSKIFTSRPTATFVISAVLEADALPNWVSPLPPLNPMVPYYHNIHKQVNTYQELNDLIWHRILDILFFWQRETGVPRIESPSPFPLKPLGTILPWYIQTSFMKRGGGGDRFWFQIHDFFYFVKRETGIPRRAVRPFQPGEFPGFGATGKSIAGVFLTLARPSRVEEP